MPASKVHTHPYFEGPFVALAHRGGALMAANQGIENTLKAFQNAAELGYRWIETDVHTTSDGVLIAFHDTHLDRVTDATGAVASLPWDVVSRARVGTEPIPRLDELLDAFPTMRFNIDIKAPGAVEPLARAIERHRAHDRVCVGSFSTPRLTAFRRRMGTRVATSVSPAGVLRHLAMPWTPPQWSGPGMAFQVPVSHDVRGHRIPVVTPGFIRRAHAQGRHVHVWTINDSHEMKRLIDLGVDGLVTDRPEVLKPILMSRGLW